MSILFFYLAFKCAIKVRLKKCQLAGNNYGNAEFSMPCNYKLSLTLFLDERTVRDVFNDMKELGVTEFTLIAQHMPIFIKL